MYHDNTDITSRLTSSPFGNPRPYSHSRLLHPHRQLLNHHEPSSILGTKRKGDDLDHVLQITFRPPQTGSPRLTRNLIHATRAQLAKLALKKPKRVSKSNVRWYQPIDESPLVMGKVWDVEDVTAGVERLSSGTEMEAGENNERLKGMKR